MSGSPIHQSAREPSEAGKPRLPAFASALTLAVILGGVSARAVDPPAAGSGRTGFCSKIDGDPVRARKELGFLAGLLVGADAGPSAQAETELRSCTRERSGRLAAKGSWSPAEAEALAALLLADPERFVAGGPFRQRILELLPEALDPRTSSALRDDLLAQLNEVRGFDFAASDALESAWKRTPRKAMERQVRLTLGASGKGTNQTGLRFDADTGGRISASVYSLPSFFFTSATARAFLMAVAQLAPEREILVLADLAQVRALATPPLPGQVHLLETYGRPYSPWPRDPFSLVRDPSGRTILLSRPNRQPGREEDLNLAAELVQNLPADLDRRWGGKSGVGWAVASAPFHNGQILLTPDAAWMTIHALEPRVLALLGTDRVPVEKLFAGEGIDRYFSAVERAAGELASLYGRPVRFVHPLPTSKVPEERARLLRTLAGAAGYDLDSLVTLVPAKGGRAALVADPAHGRELLEKASLADLESLRAGYGLAPKGEALRTDLLEANPAPAVDPEASSRAETLATFLDQTAQHLQKEGFQVRRLPLLSVPVALLADPSDLTHAEFLLSWNNVVLDERKGKVHAEGFSYLFPPGDRAAQAAFEDFGIHLDLLPPLVRSIVLNGGYRCASNHLRESAERWMGRDRSVAHLLRQPNILPGTHPTLRPTPRQRSVRFPRGRS